MNLNDLLTVESLFYFVFVYRHRAVQKAVYPAENWRAFSKFVEDTLGDRAVTAVNVFVGTEECTYPWAKFSYHVDSIGGVWESRVDSVLRVLSPSTKVKMHVLPSGPTLFMNCPELAEEWQADVNFARALEARLNAYRPAYEFMGEVVTFTKRAAEAAALVKRLLADAKEK